VDWLSCLLCFLFTLVRAVSRIKGITLLVTTMTSGSCLAPVFLCRLLQTFFPRVVYEIAFFPPACMCLLGGLVPTPLLPHWAGQSFVSCASLGRSGSKIPVTSPSCIDPFPELFFGISLHAFQMFKGDA